jgi:hypothetical protein
MLSRPYEWPLQAKFAESSLARWAPLLRPRVGQRRLRQRRCASRFGSIQWGDHGNG